MTQELLEQKILENVKPQKVNIVSGVCNGCVFVDKPSLCKKFVCWTRLPEFKQLLNVVWVAKPTMTNSFFAEMKKEKAKDMRNITKNILIKTYHDIDQKTL